MIAAPREAIDNDSQAIRYAKKLNKYLAIQNSLMTQKRCYDYTSENEEYKFIDVEIYRPDYNNEPFKYD